MAKIFKITVGEEMKEVKIRCGSSPVFRRRKNNTGIVYLISAPGNFYKTEQGFEAFWSALKKICVSDQ